MGLLESIKAPRTLTLNHWRYRILHWCFNVKTVNKNGRKLDTCELGMPHFLYTHYCPLFHLTNIIALVSPLILGLKLSVAGSKLFWKLITFLFYGTIAAISYPIGLIRKSAIGPTIGLIFKTLLYPLRNFISRRKQKADKEEKEDESETVHRQWQYLVFDLMQVRDFEDFESYWEKYSVHYNLLNKDDVALKYERLVFKIQSKREREKINAKKRQEMIVFWSNISQVVFKTFINILIVVVAACAAVGIYNMCRLFIPTMIMIGTFIKDTSIAIYSFMTSFQTIDVLWVFGIISTICLIGYAFYLMIKHNVFPKFITGLMMFAMTISPPFILIGKAFVVLGKAFVWPFKLMGHGIINFVEFCKMFYKDNCPPITIVE